MNSRNIIICAIAGILIIGLVIFLFVGDATNDTILKVGDQEYSLSDFESYVKVWNYENDSSKSSVDDMYKNFQSYKVYVARAEKAGVELESGEKPESLTSGDVQTLLDDYNLTADEYYRVKTEMAKANKLYDAPYKYAKISSDYYTNYKESLVESNPNVYDMFEYRVVEIPVEPEITVEEELSGDVTSETALVSGETSGEKAARKLAEAKEKAGEVLELAKKFVSLQSGDSAESILASLKEIIPQTSENETDNLFDYIGENTTTNRYTQNTSGFNAVANGGLDTASRLYITEDMTGDSSYLAMFGLGDFSKAIVEKVLELNEGEFSDLFESPDGYAFVYMEKITHELSEDEETRLNDELANVYIGQNSQMTFNKTLVKTIDLEKLMPKVARDAEEARKQAALASGDVAVSGEQVIDTTDNIEELYSEVQPSGEQITEEVITTEPANE